MNPYEKLGVSQSATDSEIKKAYRKLAAEHHPDKGGDEKKFKEINEAYSLISTQDKRQEFERAQNFGSFGNIFEDLFGTHYHNPRKSKPRQFKSQTDEELVFNMKISVAQIKSGITQNVVYSRNKSCEQCDGRGGSGRRDCMYCSGTGVQVTQIGPIVQQSTCRACNGRGHSFEEICRRCMGRGHYKVKESIKFEVKQK